MTAPGKLIAVEGIDGSGKRTQVELLALSLKARGHSVYSTGFPQYDSWFGQIVLVDRYIGSNLAHQTARLPPAERSEFLKWIEHLEYKIYGLPRETLAIYLRVPPPEAQALVARKSARSYTAVKQDLLEASLSHLEDAAA